MYNRRKENIAIRVCISQRCYQYIFVFVYDVQVVSSKGQIVGIGTIRSVNDVLEFLQIASRRGYVSTFYIETDFSASLVIQPCCRTLIGRYNRTILTLEKRFQDRIVEHNLTSYITSTPVLIKVNLLCDLGKPKVLYITPYLIDLLYNRSLNDRVPILDEALDVQRSQEAMFNTNTVKLQQYQKGSLKLRSIITLVDYQCKERLDLKVQRFSNSLGMFIS